MTRCRLIVHADDFGLSEKVNEGILKAHLEGIVTSTSLMACGEAFGHAVEVVRSTPTLDVGVHLTLTGEAPISDCSDVPTLLAEDGRFHAHAVAFIKRYLSGKIRLNEVEKELDAQIRRVLDNGIKVSHLDGHQHIHMLPAVRDRVGALARKYSIPAIRYPSERIGLYMLREKLGAGRLLQLVGLNVFCAMARTSGAAAPNRFFGFFFGGNLTRENLLQILARLPAAGTCELMCHPGVWDSHSRYSHWGYSWQAELDALTSREVKDHLRAAGIELISYTGLSSHVL
jgi:hopanoid biosynthesis associated protein HpnK